MEFVTLNNGLKMPMEGFGVYQVTNLSECEEAVYNAIWAGYRLIDTASVYRNEEAVGNAIRRAIEEKIVTREELFITTKLWVQDYENVQEAIESSLKKLGTDYLDLYLFHHSMGDYIGAYRVMEQNYKEGKIKKES